MNLDKICCMSLIISGKVRHATSGNQWCTFSQFTFEHDAGYLLSIWFDTLFWWSPSSFHSPQAIFHGSVVRASLATTSQRLSDTNFLFELDRITQDVEKAIVAAQSSAQVGDLVIVPHTSERVLGLVWVWENQHFLLWSLPCWQYDFVCSWCSDARYRFQSCADTASNSCIFRRWRRLKAMPLESQLCLCSIWAKSSAEEIYSCWIILSSWTQSHGSDFQIIWRLLLNYAASWAVEADVILSALNNNF